MTTCSSADDRTTLSPVAETVHTRSCPTPPAPVPTKNSVTRDRLSAYSVHYREQRPALRSAFKYIIYYLLMTFFSSFLRLASASPRPRQSNLRPHLLQWTMRTQRLFRPLLPPALTSLQQLLGRLLRLVLPNRHSGSTENTHRNVELIFSQNVPRYVEVLSISPTFY